MNISQHITMSKGARFGKGSRTIRSQSGPLSDEQIRDAAPSIFAATSHGSRSDRYSYIPTSEVLGSLRKEGFQPFMVTQGGSRDEEKRDFTKHMIRLRHESQMQVQGTVNEIILLNSHDGTSSWQLMGGLFRFVCANGMICGSFDQVRVKHFGNSTSEKVVEGCVEILGQLPETSEKVRDWSGLSLTSGEQDAFAKAALALKYEDDEAPIQAEQLLKLHRYEDAKPTLWNTLNVVQENVIRGGINYVLRDEQGRRKQSRRTREVAGIEQSVKLNRSLWILAEEMRKLKG